MALLANTTTLDFHISPLLQNGKLSSQIRQSLTDLVHDTRGETIVKLRAFVAGAGDARRVQSEVSDLFTERKLPLPVVSIVQIGALGNDAAQVVIEAVVETKKTVNPHGLAFFAGQSGPSLSSALERLVGSVNGASVSPAQVLSCTCFTSRFSDYASTQMVRNAFPHAEIDVVQSVRDAIDDKSTCEAVGRLSAAPEQGPVVLLESSRATLVGAQQLIFTGLQLTFGNFLDDAHEAYSRLQRAAAALQPVSTPVRIDAFVLDQSTASALQKTMHFPASTFTLQPIEGLPAIDASAGLEAVMAAGVAKAVVVK